MTDGTRRSASQELTAVIPREQLPPISSTQIAALGLDPSHPETRELLDRARTDRMDRQTLVPCPAGCTTCSCCFGRGMVTTEEAETWRRQQTEARDVATIAADTE